MLKKISIIILSFFLFAIDSFSEEVKTVSNSSNNLTQQELDQINYLLYTYDCDLNKDKVCDSKDLKLQQKEQQQQQNGQQGAQIAQQLMGLGQQLLGGLGGKGGGGGGGGGNTNPPTPPKPNNINEEPPSDAKKFTEDLDQTNSEKTASTDTVDRELPTTTTTTSTSSTTSTTVKKTENEEKFDQAAKAEQEKIASQKKFENTDLLDDMKSNPHLQEGPFADSLKEFKGDLTDKMNKGQLTPEQAGQMYGKAELAAHSKSSAGQFFSDKGATHITSFQQQASDFSSLLKSESNFLDQTLQNPALRPNSINLVNQELFHSFDVSSIKQFGGTCYTCGAIQQGYFTNSAEFAQMHHDIMLGNSYQGINPSSIQGLNYDNWSMLNGEPSLANKIDTQVVGKLGQFGPNGNVFNGGNPTLAMNAVNQITGGSAQLQTFGYNIASQTNFINGLDPIGQTYVWNGQHAASFSSMYTIDSATGQPIRYVLGDNSWSPTNEVFVQAIPQNAAKLTFPGGFGGMGPGGLGGFANGLFNNGFNSNNNNPYQQNANYKNEEKKKEQLKNEYDKLTQAQKDHLINSCGQIAQANNGLPGVCIVAAESLLASNNSGTSRKVYRTSSSNRIDLDLVKF